MNELKLFETRVYTERLLDINAKELAAEVLRYEFDFPNTMFKSNVGGWQSTTELGKHSSFIELKDRIIKSCEQIAGPGEMREFWANINRKYDCNQTHTHSGDLSGVLYLKYPKRSGHLILRNPLIQSEFRFGCPEDFRVHPQESQLVIFPSWLSHYVERNESDEPRISISFNYYGV